jgi:hypothetical protein
VEPPGAGIPVGGQVDDGAILATAIGVDWRSARITGWVNPLPASTSTAIRAVEIIPIDRLMPHLHAAMVRDGTLRILPLRAGTPEGRRWLTESTDASV